MCGRFALTASPEEVRALLQYLDLPNFPPRYNIAPTQPIAIVRQGPGGRRFALVRWGLVPGWVKDPASFSLLINARSETAGEKPAFRAAMRHRRCLVPASGFYEWKKMEGGRKQPFWIRPRDGGLVAFAGLWEEWSDPDSGDIETGAILTTSAAGRIAEIHDRMPVVIGKEDFADWLDVLNVGHREAAELLKPAPEDLFEAIPVSTRVNSARDDDPGLQEEVQPVSSGGEKDGGGDRKRSGRTKAAKTDGQLDLF
ncbi:SOS response-associated peptidase [Stappia sp. F7233]|uniref:Abasic site processing protein n=1 Tax=Stappia albiluteola TaxID=2758565 RepID=A0A839ALD5_9HYPH|nr:SOS response-associated peptidase [Stappia albiluteola]MBA5779259.1 SOS response-associated peptidase [Stappia albiluteola]